MSHCMNVDEVFLSNTPRSPHFKHPISAETYVADILIAQESLKSWRSFFFQVFNVNKSSFSFVFLG